MKKRGCAFLMAVLLLMAMPWTVAAAEPEVSYQVGFLTKLGILPDGFSTEQELTRAEFVCLVLGAMGGAQRYGAGSQVYFLDVAPQRADFAAINTAAALGIIHGDGNTLFHPDRTVTYEEAVGIAVNAMGYEIKVVTGGGYPVGTLTVARDIGILRNVGRDVTGGNLAKLLFNMMKEPMLSQKVVSDSTVTYAQADDDYTMLKVYWNIRYGKGQVTETSHTSQTGAGRLKDGTVRIGDDLFSEEDTKASSYYGYQVEYFYKDEGEPVNPLVYLYAKDKANAEIHIQAEDLLDVDLLSGTVRYDDGGKTGKETFSTAVQVTYNGVTLTDYTKEDLMPEYGSMTLLDHNADGVYDMVYIQDIHYFVVGSVGVDAQKVYEKYTGEILDLSRQGASVKLTKDGVETTLSHLKEYQVLSVLASRDGNKIEITVSDKVVKGTVESIDDEGEITVGGAVYQVYSGIENEPALGDTGEFYASAEGVIVAAERRHNKKIAVVCALDTSSVLNEGYCMKVVTAAGEAVWTLAGRVKLNGKVVPAAEAYQSLSTLYQSGSASRVIDYELNSEGELRTIGTPIDNTGGGLDYDESVLTLDVVSGSTSYRYFNRMMGARYLLDSDCTVVYVPTPDADGTLDPDYTVVGQLGLMNSGTSYTNFRMYGVDEFQSASVIEFTGQAYKRGVIGLSYDAPAFIVDKVTRETSAEGEPVTKIYGYQGGAYTSACFTSESEADTKYTNSVSTPIQAGSDLRVGDVLQITKENGNITAYRLLYNVVDGLDEKVIMQHMGSGYAEYPHIESVMCSVERMSDENLVVTVGGETMLYLLKDPKVFTYEDGKLEEAVLGDVVAAASGGHGSKVLIHANQKIVQEMIIFE